VIVVVVPVPAIEPGLITHVPVAGSPLKSTLPFGTAHEEGCVIVPAIGASGPPGASFMTTSVEGRDMHPASLVMLNL
jgi:hypothetical protein